MTNTATLAERRQTRHREIRALMLTTNYDRAIEEFEMVVKDLGPHIGLLCDLAGCFYEAGRFQQCWELVDRISTEYELAKDLLSERSKHQTALMLAKFYEEMAEPATAFDWLNEATYFAKTFNDKKWIYLQELRILSGFGASKGLQQRYLGCTEMHTLDDSLKVETLHALMWTEAALFGFGHAKKRWLQLGEINLNAIDERFISREFLEIALRHQKWDDEHAFVAAKQLSHENNLDYDRVLLQFFARQTIFNLNTSDEVRSIQSVSESTLNLDGCKLSLMMRLRCLLIEMNVEQDSGRKLELKKKYLFLTESLSNASQEYFKKIEPNIKSSTAILTVHCSEKQATVDEAMDSKLKLTSLQIKFLCAVDSRAHASLDFVSEQLWDCECSESYYHRLRMLVYKLNDAFARELGFTPFEIKKDGLTVHSNFQMKIIR